MTAAALIGIGVLLWLPVGSQWRVHPRPLPNWSELISRRRRGPSAVPEVLAALRDELAAGRALRVAFERAVQGCSNPASLREPVAVCRLGGDVPAALRDAARIDPLLVSLAAVWQVSEGSGAAMAAALDRLVAATAQADRLRNEIAAQLAGPRGTVRVLAVLPLVGLGMGLLMGADPLGFLFGGPVGWACLAVAVALDVGGLLWMRQMVRAIETQL
jgi:tight adherence protein B